ncbi:MAG: MATE family efflux transporter [Pseudomonadota bacterium]
MSDVTAPRHGLGVRDILPSWITRAGLRFLLITDVMVIGVFAHSFLAPVGIAYSLGGVLYAVAQGLLIGCLTLTAAEPQASAVRNATILREGLVITLVFGCALTLICQGGTQFLRLMGQEGAIADVAGPFLMLLGLGLPLHYGFLTIGYMLEAKGQRHVVASWVGAAFLLNLCTGLGLALLLDGSAQAIAWSVAISTIAIRLLALFGLWATFRARVSLVSWRALPNWSMSTGQDMRRIGLAAGAGLAIESAAFAMLSLFAGWLGAQALAAYTMLVSLVTVIFSLALAIAVLTATRIAAERSAARRRFVEGMGMALGLMAALGVLAFAFRETLVAQTLVDQTAAAIALPLVGLVGFLMLGDGGQTIASNALRAVGDAWPATLIHLSAYLCLMVGGGWLLAIPLARGVQGLIEATALASFSVLFLLSWRFWRLTQSIDDVSTQEIQT